MKKKNRQKWKNVSNTQNLKMMDCRFENEKVKRVKTNERKREKVQQNKKN